MTNVDPVDIWTTAVQGVVESALENLDQKQADRFCEKLANYTAELWMGLPDIPEPEGTTDDRG